MDKNVIRFQTAGLVKRAQGGDIQAFEELVTLYQHRLFSLCLQLANNHADAQDLAQEVFIKAYRSLESFRLEADFGTWLHRIAVNTWLNTKKKMQKQAALSLDDPISAEEGEMRREVAAATGDPVEAVEQLEFQQEVRQALNRLTEEHRSVIILREIMGYSYEEIAAMTESTLGTVKSRINRARQAMREYLKTTMGR